MCLAKVYMKEITEPILEAVIHMQLDDDGVRVQTMFGEEKVIPGRVLEVNFEESRVIVEHNNSVPVSNMR